MLKSRVLVLWVSAAVTLVALLPLILAVAQILPGDLGIHDGNEPQGSRYRLLQSLVDRDPDGQASLFERSA